MKSTPLSQVLFYALILGTAGVTATLAQTPPAAPPAAPGGQGASSVLTPDEKAQYDKAKEAALAADPALKAEDDSLTQQRATMKSQGDSVSADDRQALMAKMRDHRQKLRDAMLKIDPTLAPIFAR